jgi:broad specificity phosphatase PhoE
MALGLTATIDPLLRDCDYGRWAGSKLADLQTREPEAVAAWLSDPTATPHSGESVLDLLSRASAWLENRVGDSGHSVAITHPAIVRAAIIHAIHANPVSFWRIDIAPLSRTKLSRSGTQWRLRSISR